MVFSGLCEGIYRGGVGPLGLRACVRRAAAR